jgi:putative (di)nucleoside polyphosphate hydrolase
VCFVVKILSVVADLTYRQGAAVLARRADGRYLIVRKDREHHAWQFPQGGLEPGETAAEAAVREFTEELGTDKIRLLGDARGVHRYDFPPWANRDWAGTKYRGQEVQLFLAEYLGTDAEIALEPTELADYAWVTPAELPEYLEDPNYLSLVQKIINAG